MPDFSGPIQSIELASWLWLILFFPLVGALTNALFTSGIVGASVHAIRFGLAEPLPPKPAPAKSASRIATWSLGLSAATAIYASGLLLERSPAARYLLCHLWEVARVGQLDVSIDLAVDPLSATLTTLLTVLATIVTVYASVTGEAGKDDRAWRFFAWLGAFVAALLLAILADNIVVVFLAWQCVGLSAFGLVRATTPRGEDAGGETADRGFLLQRVGDAAILAGIALLFWGLGGAFVASGDYQPDLDPRVVAVSVTAGDVPLLADDPLLRGGAATKGKGFLTVAGLPGALVYADDSRTPLLEDGVPLRTPFVRHEMAGGVHFFRVAPDDGFRREGRDSKVAFVVEGGALANYIVARIAMGGDREVALSVVGPTLVFREMRDQLLLVTASREHPRRDALVARRLSTSSGPIREIGLLTVVCVLLLVGACAKSAQLPLQGWLPPTSGGAVSVSALLQGSGMLALGVYLVARLVFLFSLSQTASMIVALVGMGTALMGAVASMSQHDLKRALSYGSISQVGLAFVALGANLWWVAVLQLVTHAIARTCLFVATGAVAPPAHDLRAGGGLARTMPRVAWAYGAACVAITAVPVPFLSGFWPLARVAEDTFGGTALPDAFGKGLSLLTVVALGLTSFGTWRSYYLVFRGEPQGFAKSKGSEKRKDLRPEVAAILGVLGVLTVVTGAILGASGRDVGGSGEALLEAWLSPVFGVGHGVDMDLVERMGVVGVALVTSYAGWALARHRYGDGRAPDWATREPRLSGRALERGTR